MKRFTGQSKQNDLSGLANSVANGDLSELGDLINDFLKRVSDDLKPVYSEEAPTTFEIPDHYIISPESVLAKLERINVNKAPGPDGLPNWVLRDFAPWLCEPLCAVFNASVREAKVPSVWKKANVLPIPKVNPPTSIESDIRPISLTPTVSKIFESFIGSWILALVRKQLDDHQFGALKGRSTTHALVDMLHHWHRALDEGHSVRVLFVDYAKAFDHVDHNTVVQKLTTYGVPDFMVRWMTSFLCERQQRVKINQIFSDWVTLRGGMPQGSWLGPLIFIILIDDLRLWLLTHKFVDDTTVSETVSKGSTSQMQSAAEALLEWSRLNHMNINCKKTKEMIIGPLCKESVTSLTIASSLVERVSVYKLLGVMITSSLKWDDHIDVITAKAAKRLWFLKKLKRAGVSTDDLVHYYQAVVRPVLEYACPAWHTSLTKQQIKLLEDVQRRALQIIVGNVKYSEACCAVGVQSLADRRSELCRSLYMQVVNNQFHSLHYLLPQKRDIELISRLRSANTYSTFRARTNRFQNSFIQYCLSNYQ